MSQENVEVVRNALDVFNAFMRGELSRETVAKLGDPQFDFRWHDERTMPDLPQDLRGPQAFIDFWEHLQNAWDDLTVEALELIEAPDDRVLALIRQSGRGRESRVPVDVHSFQLWTIRDGRVHALELFRHRADALKAAGLEEQAMSEENARTTPTQVMRRVFDAWNRADLDTFASLFDANAEVITDPSWMEAGPFNGRGAIREWYEGLREAWDARDEVVVRELVEVEDRVVARIEWKVRGRSSGIEMDFDATSVSTVERHKIVRQQWYFDHSEAREAAGLEE